MPLHVYTYLNNKKFYFIKTKTFMNKEIFTPNSNSLVKRFKGFLAFLCCLSIISFSNGLNAQVQISTIITNVTCPGGSDGQIVAEAFGGWAPYTYTWSTGDTTSTITDLPAGDYTVTVTDIDLAIAIRTVTVDEPPALGSFLQGTASCPGGASGTLEAFAFGGTPPYSYAWSDGQTTKVATGLAPGDYDVTITDSNGCTTSASGTVNASGGLNLFTTASYETCIGSGDATATVIPSGGVAPYTFLWSDGQTTQIATGLNAGVYGVTVTDASGCTGEATQEVELSPEGVWIMLNSTPADCGEDNGTAYVGIMTGVPPYTIIWSNGDTTNNPMDLAPGEYFVTVSDVNGCTAVDSIDVDATANVEVAFSSSSNPTCVDSLDGSVAITISSGTPPYTIVWNTGDTGVTSLDNLGVGTYSVEVSDANDCNGMASITLTAPDCTDDCLADPGNLTADFNPVCLDNGTATLSATPDGSAVVPPGFEIIYVLTEGPDLVIIGTNSTPTFDVSNTGDYTIHTLVYDPATLDLSIVVLGTTTGVDVLNFITDNDICAALDVAGAPFDVVDTPTVEITPSPVTLCAGASVQFSTNVSDPNATYAWSGTGGVFDDPTSPTPTYTMMMPGTYTLFVEVTLANGCSDQDQVLVTVEDPDAGTITIDASPVCLDNGSATISATPDGNSNVPSGYETIYVLTSGGNLVIEQVNGAPTFSVTEAGLYTIHTLIYDPNTLDLNLIVFGTTTGSDVIDLLAGSGICASLDVNGAPVEVLEPPTVEISPDPVIICGGGSIQFSTNITDPNATYSWTATGGSFDDPTSANPTYTMMMPGTYTISVTVNDSNGCTASDDATVIVEAPEAGTITADASPVCLINGSADISATPDGNASVPAGYETIYVLTQGPNLVIVQANATPDFTVMAAGDYTIHTLIYNPNTLDLTLINFGITTGGDVLNLLANNGICADLDVDGAPVEVVDGPDVSISPLDAAVCSGTSVDFTSTVSGGTGSYTYSWTATGGSFDDPTVANPTYTMLMPGTYTITLDVTDSNGCATSVSTDVTINANPDITIDPADAVSCPGEPVSYTVNTSSTIASYSWTATGGSFDDPTSANPTYTMMMPGTYTISVVVIDDNGCTGEASTEVTIAPPLTNCTAEVTSSYNEGVDISTLGGSDGSASASAEGGTGAYTYEWSNGATTQEIDGLSAGTYTVTITDENGCSCTAEVTLEDPAKLGDFVWEDVDENGQQDAGEPGIEGVKATLTGTSDDGVDVMRMLETDADGMYMFDGLPPGSYKVTFGEPDGFDPTLQDVGDDATDSDADPNTGMTGFYDLDAGEYDDTVDAGFFRCLTVGDYVWFDENNSGTQEVNENGVEGVEVTLFNVGPDNIKGTADDIEIGTDITDEGGLYEFKCLDPGRYYALFCLSDEDFANTDLQWTFPNAGTIEEIDSDAIPMGDGQCGMTEPFDLVDKDRLDIDAGLRDICVMITDPGKIKGDQWICPGAIPTLLMDSIPASGGLGPIEYLWLFFDGSTAPGTPGGPGWQMIPNSNSADYQPGQLFTSTYFVRCVRRANCRVYKESNIVLVKVKTCGGGYGGRIDDLTLNLIEDQQVEVSWNTTEEPDQIMYYLERSHDGDNFTQIATVVGKGDLDNTYTHVDTRQPEGMVYYRLKTVTFDGTFESNITMIEVPSIGTTFQVYPNPVNDILHINPYGTWRAESRLEIINSVGQVVRVQVLPKETADIEINMSNLPSGVYMFRIQHEGVKYSEVIQVFKR